MAKSSLTNFPGGVLNGREVEKNANYTVVITTDSGVAFTTDGGITFTLPAIAIGNNFKFIYTGGTGANSITIVPQAADGITYAGSSTANKGITLATTVARRGDYIELASFNGTTAWQVADVRGTWAKLP